MLSGALCGTRSLHNQKAYTLCVETHRRPLTKTAFRRDVRLFLGALVGFLVVLILILALTLDAFVTRIAWQERERWNAAAAAMSARLEAMRSEDPRPDLETLRNEYGAVALAEGGAQAGFPAPGTVAVEKPTSSGIMTVWFDATDAEAMRRRARMTIAISTAAAGVGLILLFFYVPRIVEPIERMLDDARGVGQQPEGVDETHYLVATFRQTIETMKEQAAELERLNERERLRAGELELLTATLTRSLSSGFVALDPSGAIVDLNKAAREILDIQLSVSGMTIDQALPDSRFARVVGEAFAERQTLSRLEIEEGQSIIGLTTVPLTTEAGAFLGMMVLFTDVTHVRLLEQRLRDQQALADLGEMSAGVAHEFRNALSTILGHLRLARRLEPPPETAAQIAAAEKEAALLGSAVDSLLRFARPLPLEPDDVELRVLLEQLTERLSQTAPLVNFRVSGDEGRIEGDQGALRSAFENLLRNAVDAIGQRPGHVDVMVEEGDDVTVTIRDDGAGLNDSDVARLFLPFQSDRPGGTGLGLPLAKKIVVLHGGTISLAGQPTGGAIVRVTLPRGDTDSVLQPRAGHPGAGKRR